MQTYSHFLLTAVARNALRQRGADPSPAILVGSVLPDAPLALLSIGYVVDRRYLRPHLPDKTRCSPTYNDLYFNNPGWIAAHNLFHGPLPILLYAGVGYCAQVAGKAWGRPLFWFAVGCGLHSVVDILTHADDGPVVAFPLEWHYRVPAPVSYWDPQHGGRWFRIVEHLLDLLLAIFLWRRRPGSQGGAS